MEETPTVEMTENVETQATEETEVKTFTQDEVNSIVQERLDKFKKKMPSKEELDAYNNWKESQKTESEKALEKDKRIEELETELLKAKNENILASSNVNPEFKDFVFSEVSQLEGEFKDNLDSYLDSHKQYLIKKEEPVKTTGFTQNNTNTSVSEEKAYLDKKYANNPYYNK